MRLSKGKFVPSRKELWCLNDTLSMVIVDSLRKFKEIDKHSVPPHLYRNFNGEIINKNIDFSSDFCDEQWEWLLDKMIFGFEKHKEYSDIVPFDFYWDDLSNPEKFPPKVWEYHPIYGKVTEWRRVLKPQYTQKDVDVWLEEHKKYTENLRNEIEDSRKYFISYFDYLGD